MKTYRAKVTCRGVAYEGHITNDGAKLTLDVAGATFAGSDFDSLAADAGQSSANLALFEIHQGALCDCVIEWAMPVPIVSEGSESVATLRLVLWLGKLATNGGLDQESLRIVCENGGLSIESSGKSGWFEDELLDIQRQLFPKAHLKACITCAYSDYSPYGHGLFGSMMCFRNLKAEYRRVRTKDDFFVIHDRYDRMVQETYLCPDFEHRLPGTGYRG